jgi:hypothetical protein
MAPLLVLIKKNDSARPMPKRQHIPNRGKLAGSAYGGSSLRHEPAAVPAGPHEFITVEGKNGNAVPAMMVEIPSGWPPLDG